MVDAMAWEHFLLSLRSRKPMFAVGISAISITLSEIKVLPVCYYYFRLSVVVEITVFELAAVDSDRFPVRKEHKSFYTYIHCVSKKHVTLFI